MEALRCGVHCKTRNYCATPTGSLHTQYRVLLRGGGRMLPKLRSMHMAQPWFVRLPICDAKRRQNCSDLALIHLKLLAGKFKAPYLPRV